MLQKALCLTPDAYVPDLEDSVPDGEKDAARSLIADVLPEMARAGPLVVPRVNAMDSGLLEADLKAVVGPHTFGISVGKVGTASEVDHVSRLVEQAERDNGAEPGSTGLVVWLESALAIVNAYSICAASTRTVAVAFGAEDFTNDMGIQRRDDDAEIAYARSAVSVAARAAGVLALDTPFFRFRDPAALREDALEARIYGFRGKFAIHPAQIDILNEVFSPTRTEVGHARRVVEAFEEAERAGRGSTSLDGVLIDIPVVKRARNLLRLAETAGHDRGGA
jgi:citrate lyase subunit beta/citryl-CoA lyase